MNPVMSMFRAGAFKAAAVAACAAVGLALSAPAASAHDVVIGGNPADKEILQEFPDVIALEFSGYVKKDFNTFAISDIESGDILFSGSPTIEGRWVSIDVPDGVSPGPGDYRIGFQITSSDGHSTRGMTTFRVAGDGSASSASATDGTASVAEQQFMEEDEKGQPQGPLMWILAGVGVLAILGVIAMVIARGRNTTQE